MSTRFNAFLLALMTLTVSLAGASLLLPSASQQKVTDNQTRTQHAARSTQHAPLPASFHRDILPIFRTACVGCHGGSSPSSGLTLTSYANLMKGGRGGAAIVAGKSGESRLVKYLMGTLQPRMPVGGALKPAEIDRIRRWIDAGAKADAAPLEKATVARADAMPMRAVPAPATALAFSPDGKTLAVGAYREVQFWQLGGGVESERPSRLYSPLPSEERALKGRGSSDAGPSRPGSGVRVKPTGEIRPLSYSEGAGVRALTPHASPLTPESANPWHLAGTWTGHAGAIHALAFTKDGKWLAAGGGSPAESGEVRIWDVAARRETRVLGEHTDVVNALAWSPDGTRLASGSADKTIRVWDIAAGKALYTLRDHSDAVWGLAWSPDGKHLASAGADRSVKVWDMTTGRRLYSISAHDDIVYDIEFSPDGRSLLSASADRTAKLWTFGPDNSGLARTLSGHNDAVLAATFASDGQAIATASADRSVKVWNTADGRNTRSLAGAKDWVYTVRFSPDRKWIAAGTWDGGMLVWNAADGKLESSLSTLHRQVSMKP